MAEDFAGVENGFPYPVNSTTAPSAVFNGAVRVFSGPWANNMRLLIWLTVPQVVLCLD